MKQTKALLIFSLESSKVLTALGCRALILCASVLAFDKLDAVL